MPTGIYKRTKPVWNKGEKIKLLCKECGKSFKVHPYRKNSAKFCSKECLWKTTKGNPLNYQKIEKTCLNCFETFLLPFSRIKKGRDKYCSHKCYGESKKKGMTAEKRKDLLNLCLKGRIKQANMKEPTSIEKAVYAYLVNKGIVFERQKVVGNNFIVDAYIPSLNLVIECDGTYWHSTPQAVKTDKRKNDYLLQNGYNLIRLSEVEIKNGSFKERMVI